MISNSLLRALAGLYHGSQAKQFPPSLVQFVFHNNSAFRFLLVLCIALFIAVHDLFIAKVLCIGFVVVTVVPRLLPCFVHHLPYFVRLLPCDCAL
jgi:hypothetical protein